MKRSRKTEKNIPGQAQSKYFGDFREPSALLLGTALVAILLGQILNSRAAQKGVPKDKVQ